METQHVYFTLGTAEQKDVPILTGVMVSNGENSIIVGPDLQILKPSELHFIYIHDEKYNKVEFLPLDGPGWKNHDENDLEPGALHRTNVF